MCNQGVADLPAQARACHSATEVTRAQAVTFYSAALSAVQHTLQAWVASLKSIPASAGFELATGPQLRYPLAVLLEPLPQVNEIWVGGWLDRGGFVGGW
jgi:hypothetical protein